MSSALPAAALAVSSAASLACPPAFAEVLWRGQSVRIEYQRINAADAGAPLVVFLHEGLGSLAMWRDFPQRLCEAAGVNGIVYSRPAYGRSTSRAPDERWQPDFMHRQAFEVLPALLQALDITALPILLGHSDGGSIALLHAARHPARAVIVLAPHLFVEDVSVASIEAIRGEYLKGGLPQRLRRYHDNVDSAFWGWCDIWLDPAFRDWNIEAEVERIMCPVLALQGIDDEYGTLDQIHAIRRLLPRAELIELERCGHSPHRDRADAVITAATHFIHDLRRQP